MFQICLNEHGYPGWVILDKPDFAEHSSICLIPVCPNKELRVANGECFRNGLNRASFGFYLFFSIAYSSATCLEMSWMYCDLFGKFGGL